MKNILSSFSGSLICYTFIPVFVRLILVLYNHQRDVITSVFTVSIFRPVGLLILHFF